MKVRVPPGDLELLPDKNWLGCWHDGRIPQMLITTGQVHRGAIEVDSSSLPEGTKVTILVHEDDGTFELSAEEEAKLLAAMAEAERGDGLGVPQVLHELRKT